MIEIDFFGGLHGNFLCYAINALDDQTKKVQPFTTYGTSHQPYKKTLAVAKHYTLENKPFQGQDVISITANDCDCLLVNLLCFGRAGDYNFDLKNFHVDFYDNIKNTGHVNDIELISRAYGIDVKQLNSVPRGILREYYKFNFKNYSSNSIMIEIKKQKYNFDVLEVDFKLMYDFEDFVSLIARIVDYFDLPYCSIDREFYKNLWQEFRQKLQFVDQANAAYDILAAVKNGQNKIIDFNLIQESWLNAQLELVYNKEMPFDQEKYFVTTQEILDYLNEI